MRTAACCFFGLIACATGAPPAAAPVAVVADPCVEDCVARNAMRAVAIEAIREDCSVECAGCALEVIVAFGAVGGHVAYLERARIQPGGRLVRERTTPDRVVTASPVGDFPGSSCVMEIPPCPGPALDVGDVARSLRDPEVAKALAVGGLFGSDPRPADGQLFEICAGASCVLVGPDCSTHDVGCRSVPTGLAATVELLRALDAEVGPCPTP